MAMPALNGLLLRFPAGARAHVTALGSALGAAGSTLELEPLFVVDSPRAVTGFGVAADASEWYVARPRQSVHGAHPWDAAYEVMTSAPALAAAGPEIAEPDLLQEWPHHKADSGSQRLAANPDICAFNDQVNGNLPRRAGEFAWHLADEFSQLRSARTRAGNAGVIRIAHLDTGYDPDHATFPGDRIEQALQRNFIDRDRPNDARDPHNSGLLRNPGHGTGTLSILSGGHFSFVNADYRFDDILGGAPAARIVPIRVGNSVVQVSTSSVAGGIGYAADLCANAGTRVDVISMSMGGVASAAWADAVNKAYEAGIIFVAAAGNNFSAGRFPLPTRFIVYPARFRRVIAACGIMADRRPYYGLPAGTMQGNFGPSSKMATAIAAWTPNMPWAEIGCAGVVDMDGAGTSAATPQVAAAAALYLQAHARELFDAARYPEPWMRVEAVRHALLESADRTADRGSSEKLGRGIIKAANAISLEPPAAGALRKTPPDSASFGFLRVLTGLGATASPLDQMLALEATQLALSWNRNNAPNPLESVIEDPDAADDQNQSVQVRQYLEALHDHPDVSSRLKSRIEEVVMPRGSVSNRSSGSPTPPRNGRPKRATGASGNGARARADASRPPRKYKEAAAFAPPTPAFRMLRGYAIDPSLSNSLGTQSISEVMFYVRWEEKLKAGPQGEYLDVVDIDPTSDCFYEPVDLNNPHLLAQNGLAPSEGTPQFHQQMVYAVSQLTIDNFEHSLGRRVLWRPRPIKGSKNDSNYVRRLRVHPHALREANAYYSPEKIALLFGYFNADDDDRLDHMPEGRVFTCLSHDVVAHETTHALLDGMHRRFLLPSNPDVRAFHEAFADLVALFQHFTFPEILRHQIAETRGDIRLHQNLLGELAGQFGRSTGLRGALRSGIGRMENGTWVPARPNPDDYQNMQEPHLRGAILVAAVFDAFLSIYEKRVTDLFRLATGGSGVLQPGAIHPDLVSRLAAEASKSAQHVLTMCIRALDYCPPTDITFGEYLRAIITADHDLVHDDDLGYRVAFVEAFRRRGLYPRDLKTLSVESLLWREPNSEDTQPSKQLQAKLEELRKDASDHLYAKERSDLFKLQRNMRSNLHQWLKSHFNRGRLGANDAKFLGIDPKKSFEVHTARFAYRTSPDGESLPQLLLGLLQDDLVPVDSNDPTGPTMPFEGGCTLIADLRTKEVRYCIRKSQTSNVRRARQEAFAATAFNSVGSTYFGAKPLDAENEPFAAIHRGL
jgi:subtilisin family serine protease